MKKFTMILAVVAVAVLATGTQAAINYSVDSTIHTIDFSAVGAATESIQIADLDGDGYLDLAAQAYDGHLHVFLNNQSTTGSNFSGTAAGANYILSQNPDGSNSTGRGCAIGDWNHDGKLDVANTPHNNYYYQNATGTLYSNPSDYTNTGGGYVMGYGIVSANTGNAAQNYGTVLKVSSGCGYQISYQGTWDGTGYTGSSYINAGGNVRAVDMNGDGLEDIICSKGHYWDHLTQYGRPSIFYATPGVATFDTLDVWLGGPEGSQVQTAWGIAAGDFNGDGKMDIVTAEDDMSGNRNGTLNFHYQNAAGGFTSCAPPDKTITGLRWFASSNGARAFAGLEVGDFNMDGMDDVVVVDGHYAERNGYIFMQDETSGFEDFSDQTDASITFNHGGVNLCNIKIGDLNLDGAPDMLFGYVGTRSVHIMYGESLGVPTGAATPEPATLCVLGIGGLGILIRRRRTRK